MKIEKRFLPYPFPSFNSKIRGRIEKPRCMGAFTSKNAEERGMRFAQGSSGSYLDGEAIRLFWLIDPLDGTIVDAVFHAFGSPILIAAADAACELSIGKTYDQVKRITLELIDKQLRDKQQEGAFPQDAFDQLHCILDAIEMATKQCADIPLSQTLASPLPREFSDKEKGGFPAWLSLAREEKLAAIEAVLDEEIRPYIALDEGGIEILDLIEDRELIIAYKGACTSCYSSIGATLSTIQEILRTKIHSDLTVVPNMDDLKF